MGRRLVATLVRYNRFLGRAEQDRVFPPWVESFLPWIVFGLLGCYIALSAYSVHVAENFTWAQLAPFVALVVLGLAFGVWFIVCFTGDATNRAEEQDRRRRQSFRFCYVFTLSTIVVLIVPVTNPWQPDVVGPISLIRGCVDARSDPGIPPAIRCGNDDLEMRFDGRTGGQVPVSAAEEPGGAQSALANGPGQTQPASAPLPAASAPPVAGPVIPARPASSVRQDSSPKPSAPTRGASGAIPASASKPPVASSAANAASVASGTSLAKQAGPASASGTPASAPAGASAAVASTGASGAFQRRFGRHPGFVYEPSYPWLIVIGGTYATAGTFDPRAGSTVSGDAKTGAMRAHDASPTAAPDAQPLDQLGRKPHQVIEGGFVLPYYIVLLAFLGASIALTRRIPELQKRSEPGYEGTTDQPMLDFKTVREAVVFQIMQLVTAPFVAMVAFYAIAPGSAGSGIAVGFISGFSSELVLLQIRGVVEGLFPKSVSRTAETTARTGDVVGRVTFYDAGVEGRESTRKPELKPAANVVVRINAGTGNNAREYTDTTDTNGEYAIAGVLTGSYVLSATSLDSSGRALSGKRLFVVAPGAEVRQDIILAPTGSEQAGGSPAPAPGTPPAPSTGTDRAAAA